jgi:hypothetical protein
MDRKKVKREIKNKTPMSKSDVISYRLKCAKTANGLTHFVMYGDVPKKKMPL